MIKKIINNLRIIFIGFFYGLRNTESDILGQKTTSLSPDNSIQQKQQLNQLGEALLKGEVTEEVEMLRDRTYFVSDESKKYKVIINTVGTSKAVKKSMTAVNVPEVYNTNNECTIKIIMDNLPTTTGVLTALESVGGYGIKNQYPIFFEYENTPKFKLEDYVKKLVIKINNETNNTIVDLYVPRHTDSFERMEKLFDNEINKIYTNKIKPINVEFKELNFISNKCYGIEDLYEVKINFIKFIGVNEYDGKYILSYEVEASQSCDKITEKYKNEKLRKAYENKETRNTVLNLNPEKKKIYCDKCGKEMESEYDYRITKVSTGKGLCKECLTEFNKKHLKN